MKNIATPAHRFIAGLIDAALWLSVFGELILLVARSETTSALFNTLMDVVILALLLAPVQHLLSGLFITKFGGTIGKLLTGIEITDESGKRISFWRAIFRQTIGYAVSGILLWLGFIWIFVDKERQGWHDMMAGTVVVIKKSSLVWLGLFSLVLLVLLDIWFVQQIVSQFKLHSGIYQEIFLNIFSNFPKAAV